MAPGAGGSGEKNLDQLVAERVEAALKDQAEKAKRSKEPETMAELIDRVSDITVEKLLAKLGEEEGGGEGEGERPPLGEHPWFSKRLRDTKSA